MQQRAHFRLELLHWRLSLGAGVFTFPSVAFLYLVLVSFARLIMVSSEEPSLWKEVIPDS